MLLILTVPVRVEDDVVSARQRARQVAALLGFDQQDQARIATAVSEIARNAFVYANDGRVEFLVDQETTPLFLIRITDRGPGIANLRRILAGQHPSSTGIMGTRQLMDRFQIESSPERGTTVLLGKHFPKGAVALDSSNLSTIADELAGQVLQEPLEELWRQNQELLCTLDELRTRQEQLTQLNRELEDTNRGVLALYTELDEKAEQLTRANRLKSLFLSSMGHEFRTPVNSILSLSWLLQERSDGELTAEQAKQVAFIREAAQGLSELVNDLLDSAKAEAGKLAVRRNEFEVADLWAAMRGMFRPLLRDSTVDLLFEEPNDIPPMYTDEGKVSQILRNFISNALKFTEHGQVRVSATLDSGRQAVVFSVADTGIGIAREDQERIFEEYIQVEHHIQRRVKGTGLGLPLSKRLAELLEGGVEVQSTPGRGATFSAIVPLAYAGSAHSSIEPEPPRPQTLPSISAEDQRAQYKVLIIDDEETDRYLLKEFLREAPYTVIEATSGWEGLHRAREDRPQVILLDLNMPEMSGFETLKRLKADAATSYIPIVVVSSKSLGEEERRFLDSNATTILSKAVLSPEATLAGVRQALAHAKTSQDRLLEEPANA